MTRQTIGHCLLVIKRMSTELIPLSFPDHEQYKVVSYNATTTLIVERAVELGPLQRNIELKSHLVFSQEGNSILMHEYDILQHIRTYHSLNNLKNFHQDTTEVSQDFTKLGYRNSKRQSSLKRQSMDILTVNNIMDNNHSTTNWTGPATLNTAGKTIPECLETRTMDDSFVLVFLDFGGVPLSKIKRMDSKNDSEGPSHDFTIEEVLKIAINISQGLELAHRADVMHQEVNPDNIMVKFDPKSGLSAQLSNFAQSQRVSQIFSEIRTFSINESLVYISPGNCRITQSKQDAWKEMWITELVTMLLFRFLQPWNLLVGTTSGISTLSFF